MASKRDFKSADSHPHVAGPALAVSNRRPSFSPLRLSNVRKFSSFVAAPARSSTQFFPAACSSALSDILSNSVADNSTAPTSSAHNLAITPSPHLGGPIRHIALFGHASGRRIALIAARFASVIARSEKSRTSSVNGNLYCSPELPWPVSANASPILPMRSPSLRPLVQERSRVDANQPPVDLGLPHRQTAQPRHQQKSP